MLVTCVVVVVSIPVLLAYHRATGVPRPTAAPATATPTPEAGASQTPAAPEPAPPAAEQARSPESGSGHTRVARFARPSARDGRLVRVRVEVENEVPADPDEVARISADTLQDRRSWDGVRFDFVGDQPADLTIHLSTPTTTDRRCRPLETRGEVSCQNGSSVNLNARRWLEAVPDFRGDVPLYRQYLVNHEVGHYLGHGHVPCPGPGRPAPVMQQQTKGLDGCLANPWP